MTIVELSLFIFKGLIHINHFDKCNQVRTRVKLLTSLDLQQEHKIVVLRFFGDSNSDLEITFSLRL
jgi:hypothetical protein